MSSACPSRFAFWRDPAVALILAVSGCTRSESAKVEAKEVKAPASPRKNTAKAPARIPARCTPAWNQEVDRRLGITDSTGHGPDIGSAEWMNAVSRKSGVFDAEGHGPDPGSDEWCRAVDYKVFGRR